MGRVTIRELGDRCVDIVDRVTRGEQITITRAGKPVAELRAVATPALGAEALLARWHALPTVDPSRVRADLDALFDPSL